MSLRDAESYRTLTLRFYPDLGWVETETDSHPSEVAVDLYQLAKTIVRDPEIATEILGRPITGRRQEAFARIVGIIEFMYYSATNRHPTLAELKRDLGDLLPSMDADEIEERLRLVVAGEVGA
jgi:hypothetical protein